MKKCILSAVAGAMAMFLLLAILANIHAAKKQKTTEYEHIDYVSNISREQCFVCGESPDIPYWSQDNVGIVNLNTFELLHLAINRYDEHGTVIGEPAGFMERCSLVDNETEAYVHAAVFPDHAYASVHISGVSYAIDKVSVQNHLCQTCLDSINRLWFTNQPPAEYAIISFEDRTIRPLLNSYPWFSAGNYGVNCTFMDGGDIDLLIHYCKSR